MLSLTRKAGEGIRLTLNGKVIAHIKVSGVHGGKVRLGIDAPQETRIARDELPPRPAVA
jgi:carbon storage regulator CsrA